MRRVRIYGASPHKEEVRKAVTFFLKELIPNKRKYDITIILKKGLIEEEESFGECWKTDTHNYNIRLDAEMKQEGLLKTLAHECVHVKQFSSGILKFKNKFDMWGDKVYYRNAKYETLPWEIEATKLESILYINYLNRNSNLQK